MNNFAFPNSDLLVGDTVTVPTEPTWGTLEVMDVRHSSLVRARRADGVELTIGRGAVQKVKGAAQ